MQPPLLLGNVALVVAAAKRAKRPTAVEAFMAKVEFDTNGGCWLCAGAPSVEGYGEFKHDGRREGFHRASWRLFRGPIPEGMSVLHRCDVRPCGNPNHLFLGTQGDNVQDCIAKGRRVQNMERERIGGTPRRNMTRGRRKAAYDRAGGRCGCGSSLDDGYDADHTIPLALGGADDDENLVALCIPCHKAKTKRDISQIAKAKRQEKLTKPKVKSKNPIRSAPKIAGKSTWQKGRKLQSRNTLRRK